MKTSKRGHHSKPASPGVGRGEFDVTEVRPSDLLAEAAAAPSIEEEVDQQPELEKMDVSDIDKTVDTVFADKAPGGDPDPPPESRLEKERQAEAAAAAVSELEKDLLAENADDPITFDEDPLVGEIEEAVEPIPVESQIPDPISLEHAKLVTAWDTLSQTLVDHVRIGVNNQAEMLRIPEWQLVCGLIAQAHASGGLTNPQLDPAWSNPVPIPKGEAVCGQCGTTFKPKFRGQGNCSRECGEREERIRQDANLLRAKAARQAEIDKMVAEEMANV